VAVCGPQRLKMILKYRSIPWSSGAAHLSGAIAVVAGGTSNSIGTALGDAIMTAILLSIPPALTALLLAILSGATLFRFRQQPFRGLFSLLCLFGCFLNLDILMQLNAKSAQTALRHARQWHLLHPFLVPLFIHFFHVYLRLEGRRWILGLAYGVAAVVAVFSQGDGVISHMARFSFGYAAQGGRLYPVMAAGAVLATLYNALILHRAVRKQTQSVQKNKIKYILAGFLSLGVLTCLNLTTRLGYAVYPPGSFGFIPLTIFSAGVLTHDLMDIGVLLRKILVQGVLVLLLAVFNTIIIMAVQAYSTQAHLSDAMVQALLMGTVAAIVFSPLKNSTQALIAQLTIRQCYDYRKTIKQASQVIASVLDVQQITGLLKNTLIRAMGVSHGALFIGDPSTQRFVLFAAVGQIGAVAPDSVLGAQDDLILALSGNNGPLVRQKLLDGGGPASRSQALEAMGRLNAEIVLPMLFRSRLNGFLVLGEKLSGRMFLPDDLDLLETLSHQSAMAIENARAYSALRDLNQHLEARVAARTRELEQALREKERTREQLVRSESLAAIGQLVAGVAHELNNPLTSVTSLLQSNVEDLERLAAPDASALEMIDDLRFADKELARAKSIVTSLLGLSRQTQTYEEAVDLNVVVTDVLRMLHNRWSHKKIEITSALAPQPVLLQGNFANLGQVVVNIVTNAIQAVPESAGIIHLRTGLSNQHRVVQFSCEDNGPGIQASICRDVFKPFFTTKVVGEGTGLGLYICHEIIRKHGGTIGIEASRLGGAAVRFEIPAAGSG
jgi:signal transduction histidine kinase